MRWPRFIRRRTMLPPMRPRPTIPISMVLSSRKWALTPLFQKGGTPPLCAEPGEAPGAPLCQPSPLRGEVDFLLDRRSDRRRQRLPSGRRLLAERHAQDRETPRCQRLQIAERLRLLEDREAVRLAGDGHVAGVVR